MEYRGGFTYTIKKGCESVNNADKIRSMSDEELAEMLWKTGRNYRAVCADPVVDHDEQYAEIVKWLQQPAEDIGDGN